MRHRAAFRPRRTEDLRPELLPLIGETATWRFAGTSNDDEPYPGQTRWNTDDPRFEGYWAPEEDLDPRPDYMAMVREAARQRQAGPLPQIGNTLP